MEEQQKKFSGWRLGILGVVMTVCCLMMTVGFSLLNLRRGYLTTENLNPSDAGGNTADSDTYWIDKREGNLKSHNSKEKTFVINGQADLAEMNYRLTKENYDYSGSTFELETSIKLDKVPGNYDGHVIEKTPLWTPIEIGTDKNRNITFNGNGNIIEGMTINIESDSLTKVGFFAEMVGGVFQNVTFLNPVIEYTYTGKSLAADDPLRPDAPIDVCLGVIAGAADTTYINNVEIINPIIKFTADNLNGHNFYVGTAVGKLTFTSTLDENNKVITTNTVTPKQWGLDTVNVSKDLDNSLIGTTMTINAGNKSGVTYGYATNGYLGGLVGVNISSKIINSTITNYAINPQLDSSVAGIYGVGGLAGMTTQIAHKAESQDEAETVKPEKLVVAAGLYNNLLSNVTIGTTQVTNCRGGQLAGRVYSGSWLYNNVVVGDMGPNGFWGQFDNSRIYLVDDPACIASICGSIDHYFLDNENKSYARCGWYEEKIDGEVYLHCSNSKHTSSYSLKNCDIETMSAKNFYFPSVTDSDYKSFISDKETDKIPVAGTKYSKYELLNYYNDSDGYMYYAALPIVEYETGLTVNEKSLDNATTRYEKRVEAIYQFRTWTNNNGSQAQKLRLADYYGADYSIVFEANSPHNSKAYFHLPSQWVGYYEDRSELTKAYTYQQYIVKPEECSYPILQCEGYECMGWELLSPKTGEALTWGESDYLDPTPITVNGINQYRYNFGEERIKESGYRFRAIWAIQDYEVEFIVRDGGKEKSIQKQTLAYKSPVVPPADDPMSEYGLTFKGWFLENDLPPVGQDADPEKSWFKLNPDKTMPAGPLKLYSGWADNFTEINEFLNDEKYKTYYDNVYIYFQDGCGIAFKKAWEAAKKVRQGDSDAGQALADLRAAKDNLRVDPSKLRTLAAFNESLWENACPFLYDYTAYLKYLPIKKDVDNYIKKDKDNDLTDIVAYQKYYDLLTRTFNNLKNNLNPNVKDAGGLESERITRLIDKYNTIQERENNLTKSLYDNDSLTRLDLAKSKAEDLWNSSASNPSLKDVELAVDAYEDAINKLQPKGASGIGTSNADGSGKSTGKNGVSPVLISVLIVLVLMACAGGYIGVDIVLNKRRGGQKTGNTNSNQKTQAAEPEEEEDTYI